MKQTLAAIVLCLLIAGPVTNDASERRIYHCASSDEVHAALKTVKAGDTVLLQGGKVYEIEKSSKDPEHAMKGVRPVFFEEFKGYGDCKTYDRYSLKANNEIQGPAIVEQMDTTIVIPPRQRARVDRFGNIIMDVIP